MLSCVFMPGRVPPISIPLLIRGDRFGKCVVWSENSAFPRASDLIGNRQSPGVGSSIRKTFSIAIWKDSSLFFRSSGFRLFR
jgi:hypothetical protein